MVWKGSKSALGQSGQTNNLLLGDYGHLPALATELVQNRVTVLVATGGDASARAAKQATANIPVVFNTGSDPVKAGLVQSLNRPGGNVTGSVIMSDAMEQKRFGFLQEVAPGITFFGALVNPNYPPSASQVHDRSATTDGVV